MNKGFLRSLAHSLREEWPYMDREGRKEIAERNPEVFLMAKVRMDAPQRPVPEEPEFED
jgi:hypothetical protein